MNFTAPCGEPEDRAEPTPARAVRVWLQVSRIYVATPARTLSFPTTLEGFKGLLALLASAEPPATPTNAVDSLTSLSALADAWLAKNKPTRKPKPRPLAPGESIDLGDLGELFNELYGV